MSERIRALRGFNDLLPGQSTRWREVLDTLRRAMSLYGYGEIKLPVLESTDLFARSVGEATDIVEKEMFSFLDREKTMMSLRPEGTAGCVRAGIDHGLLHNQQQRLWYEGPMFRHERPQKGRYRQFYQLGLEAFGMDGPDIDVEIIALFTRALRDLGLLDHGGAPLVQLELNTLGTSESRDQYRAALVEYLERYQNDLDEDSVRRLQSNPLRVLDSKDPTTRQIVSGAPLFDDFLDPRSAAHFASLQAGLRALNIAFVLNPRLVRGLDYYTRTVFEWTTPHLGAQSTICAGGRYDGLVALLGGGQVPAVGFAAGIDRVALLLEHARETTSRATDPTIYLCVLDAMAENAAAALAETLRDQGLRVLKNAGGGKLKAQLKRADRAQSHCAVILGEAELADGVALLKPLQNGAEQQRLPLENMPAALQAALAN